MPEDDEVENEDQNEGGQEEPKPLSVLTDAAVGLSAYIGDGTTREFFSDVMVEGDLLQPGADAAIKALEDHGFKDLAGEIRERRDTVREEQRAHDEAVAKSSREALMEQRKKEREEAARKKAQEDEQARILAEIDSELDAEAVSGNGGSPTPGVNPLQIAADAARQEYVDLALVKDDDGNPVVNQRGHLVKKPLNEIDKDPHVAAEKVAIAARKSIEASRAVQTAPVDLGDPDEWLADFNKRLEGGS